MGLRRLLRRATVVIFLHLVGGNRVIHGKGPMGGQGSRYHVGAGWYQAGLVLFSRVFLRAIFPERSDISHLPTRYQVPVLNSARLYVYRVRAYPPNTLTTHGTYIQINGSSYIPLRSNDTLHGS